ncbi:MAG: L,D-transpeptidase [Gammaproteobacteria bacterium]|nr:L,D-transpeptidase [Gammaproteobacteria bacterium]
MIIFFGMTICMESYAKAKTPSAYSTSNLSSDEDPDADGDSKGINFFPSLRVATGNKIFIFDPNHTAWAVYDEEGNRINTGKASGGRLYCPDVGRRCTTVSGEFKIVSKGGAGCTSSKYPIETNGGAPMPYCMHFGSKGYAIHGSNDVPHNRNASHGCIRITPTAAKWLNQNFVEIGTAVLVYPYNNN